MYFRYPFYVRKATDDSRIQPAFVSSDQRSRNYTLFMNPADDHESSLRSRIYLSALLQLHYPSHPTSLPPYLPLPSLPPSLPSLSLPPFLASLTLLPSLPHSPTSLPSTPQPTPFPNSRPPARSLTERLAASAQENRRWSRRQVICLWILKEVSADFTPRLSLLGTLCYVFLSIFLFLCFVVA